MKELYELKDNLCDELKKYGKKELSAGSLDVVDKLSHSIKNIDKVIEKYEESEGYSNARNGRRNYRNSYEMRYDVYGTSNARGGRGGRTGGSSRAGYSNEGYSYDDMMSKLYELMEEAPDDKTRQEFMRFIQRLEAM